MRPKSLAILSIAVACAFVAGQPASAGTCPAGWVDITAKVNNPAYPLVCESKACSCADFNAKKCRVVFPPASSIVCDKGSIPEQPGGGCTTGCVATNPPQPRRPDLKIHADWGSSNVGSTRYGPKLTGYISVTNVGTADCVPPAGQQFVVGLYFKTIGLIKATSVGPFPTHIAPGQTVNFVAQGVNQVMLTPQYQNVVYNGYVDFYVASRNPAGPELSAAINSACAAPEISIPNNNAHSVKKVVTNP
ncbi:MAG TPA: hypothetical protein VF173_15900 [Thermoanaerobaculia bacterium]|nr:hypothetical protein [Thermoanaerobaculia bacterium]